MYAKTIKYTDFNDVERSETFYFHISEPELVEMEMSTGGGMEAFIKKITEAQDGKQLAKLFKDLIIMSYGEKDLDGKRFRKSKEISESFVQTEAYSILYMELLTNIDAAKAFMMGIMPKKVQEEAKKLEREGKLNIDASSVTPLT